ncbi:MAG: PIN domain-containing protein [Gemmatimonadaceae bacterium]|jgi:predicted nucleic acid-binding protein|nr:PIN domain-containing protein [Gemmatimonadaceae bacterium]
MRFVDTNVLLYAISHRPDEGAKAARARTLLRSRDLACSAQVLQEFVVQATHVRHGADAMPRADAAGFVHAMTRFPVQPITASLVLAALDTSTRWQISYWDAAIVEAARALGCAELLSEDLQPGMDFDGVRVVNPFA